MGATRASDPAHAEDGAYGFRIHGIAARRLLGPASPEAPRLEVACAVGRTTAPVWSLTLEQAEMPLQGGGHLVVLRKPLRATYVVPQPIDDEALVHPYLVPAAAVAAHWNGWNPFHAGGVVLSDGVWAVVGGRSSGKSSLLASLALAGVPVVCDDLLVVAGDKVQPGPRCVDLRADAAERIGAGERLGAVGGRERWRLTLPALPQQEALTLSGWIFLEWGSDLGLEAVAAPDRLTRVVSQRTIRIAAPDQRQLFALLDRPSWILRRPPDWSAVEASLALLDRLTSSAGG